MGIAPQPLRGFDLVFLHLIVTRRSSSVATKTLGTCGFDRSICISLRRQEPTPWLLSQ
jgi:hypothetical protein